MKPTIFTPDDTQNNANETSNEATKPRLDNSEATASTPRSVLPTFDAEQLQKLALVDKTLLITGACQGIGHTLALTAAAAGAELILLDKSIPALEQLYDDVMQLNVGHTIKEPFLLPIDMAGANLDDYLKSAELLGQEITQLDGIVHNAAHFGGLYALMQTPPEDLLKQIHVNYTAPIWLTQAMFPLLLASPLPTLLFADHEESHADDVAYYNTYAGSKVALMQAMKQLAIEHDNHNLYAYGYNTGWVNTVLSRQAYPDAHPDWAASYDSEIACAILALFSRQHENGSIVKC